MTEEQFGVLTKEVKTLSRLMALSVTAGKPQAEQITMLSLCGFPRKEIAEFLGTTPNTVSVTLSKAKSGGKKKSKPRT